MLIACWSVKGGSGTTVVAASLAVLASRGATGRRRALHAAEEVTPGVGALLVDLGGDVPATLGAAEPSGPGVADWLRAGARVPPDGWGRLEVTAAPGLAFVPRGLGALVAEDRAEVLAGILAEDGRIVVVDCGLVPTDPVRRGSPPSAPDELARGSGPLGAAPVGPVEPAVAPWPEEVALAGRRWPAADVPVVLAAAATVSLLVVRPCYLALRRAASAPITPSGVVVVHEPGRSLTAADVEDVLGVPVVAEVPFDPAVARSVDSGLLVHRLPRGLERSLRDAA